MQDHKELDVWKSCIDLVEEIYQLTNTFPKEEIYGVTNQIRRAAISIPSNIAEGAGRQTSKEFVHFLYIAAGSLAELETQIIIAERLKYTTRTASISARIVSIRKMLHGLIRHYRTRVPGDG